jgi:CRP/FNR family transcriptional regulator, cyclic AMP receptor protein
MPSPEPAEALPDHYSAVLHSGKWFAQLPVAFADALLGMARVLQLQAGEALFLRGDPPRGLYALVRGSIRISGQSEARSDAREAVLIMLTPPTWFGEISVFDGSARTHNAHAAEPSILLQVPHEALSAWLAQNPLHWRNLALLMSDKLRIAFVNMEEQTLLPAPLRLARRLTLMAQGYGQSYAEQGFKRELAVTQEQLALMLGISRQTCNQILNDLKVRGVVDVQRGTIAILDTEALKKMGQ